MRSLVLGRVLADRGACWLALGERSRARSDLEQALDLLDGVHYLTAWAGRAQWLLARLLREAGEVEAAAAHARDADSRYAVAGPWSGLPWFASVAGPV